MMRQGYLFFGWIFLTASFTMLMISQHEDGQHTVDYTFHFNADKHNVTGNSTGPQVGMTLTSGMLDHSKVRYEFFVDDTTTKKRTSLCTGKYDHDSMVLMANESDASKKTGRHSDFSIFIVNVAAARQMSGYSTDYTSDDPADRVTNVNANANVEWDTIRFQKASPGDSPSHFNAGKARVETTASGTSVDYSLFDFSFPCEPILKTTFDYKDYDNNGSETTVTYSTPGQMDEAAVNRFTALLTMVNPGKATTALASGVQAGVDALNYHGTHVKCQNDMIYDNVAQSQAISSDLFWYSVITYILATFIGVFYILDAVKGLFSLCSNNDSQYYTDVEKSNLEDEAANGSTSHESKFIHVIYFLVSVFTTVLIGLMLMQYDNLHDSLKYEGGLEKTCNDHTDTDIGLERTPWFVVTCIAIGFYGLTALTLVPVVWTGYCQDYLCSS